jgi:hypothetical protein
MEKFPPVQVGLSLRLECKRNLSFSKPPDSILKFF